MKDVIIFDWNGTLIDDASFTMEIENDMLAARGMKTVTMDEYRELFCFPVIDYYVKLGYDFEKEPFEQLSEEFMNRYVAEYTRCPLTPHAEDVLKKLKAEGKTLVIVSATQQDHLNQQVRQFGVDKYFDQLIGTDTIHATGKAERARQWILQAGIAPDRAVMVGDSAHDTQAADAMGVDCVLVATGHESARRLRLTHHPVAQNLEEFYQIIKDM